MNGNIFNPRVNGIENVIAHYKHCLSNVCLYGPTHFGSIIETVNDKAEFEPTTFNN